MTAFQNILKRKEGILDAMKRNPDRHVVSLTLKIRLQEKTGDLPEHQIGDPIEQNLNLETDLGKILKKRLKLTDLGIDQGLEKNPRGDLSLENIPDLLLKFGIGPAQGRGPGEGRPQGKQNGSGDLVQNILAVPRKKLNIVLDLKIMFILKTRMSKSLLF